jgi:N-acetyl-1-D-myo-inositol-2-amino-2-deoxy-alpha-D-glucopyranoside deacetylase
MLLVHAHPDDESIGNGATMARYAAEGAQVTLVTCTLGEEGEILVPSLSLLASSEADQLGGWRLAELTAALAELGVIDQRFLAGAGRFRDSGMIGTAANGHPRAFWAADAVVELFEEAVTALVEIIRELRPQVVLTYDEFGGYGHPDHLMAHRVATAAVTAAAQADYPAGGDPWEVAKFYWNATPRSVYAEHLAAIAGAELPFDRPAAGAAQAFTLADDLVTTVVHGPQHLPAKQRAMAAHATQIMVDGRFFALSNNVAQVVSATEYYRLVLGQPGGPRDEQGRETDLFGGIES